MSKPVHHYIDTASGDCYIYYSDYPIVSVRTSPIACWVRWKDEATWTHYPNGIREHGTAGEPPSYIIGLYSVLMLDPTTVKRE